MPGYQANKEIRYGTKLHRDVLEAIIDRRDYSIDEMSQQHQKWKDAENQFLAYLPETESDAKRRHKRETEGKPQYTTIEVPYSYALLMTAHTYWSSVFMGRTPIFQFSGRHGEGQMQTQAMEALVDYQVHVGQMQVPIYIWLLDTGKYGLGIVGNYWDEEEQVTSEIVEQPKTYLGMEIPGTSQKVRKVHRTKGYQGNKLFNVRPYDWRPDPRVPINRFQDGEFCGRAVDVTWNDILRGEDQEYYFNVDVLQKHRADTLSTKKQETDDAGSGQIVMPDDEGWRSYLSRADLNTIALEEMVIELSPKDWGLGKTTAPEKWFFTVANDQVVISARPLGYLHNKFPFAIMEYEPEGYGLFSRSMLEVVKPLNDGMTWLFNQHFYNMRKAINDQFVFDPSRLVVKDVMSDEPGKMIRMKPRAYGQDIRTMIQQFPAQDVTRGHVEDAMSVASLMQRVLGVTDNIMGQVNEGGRKTATEVRSSNSASLNRMKTNAEYQSAMGFEPLGQMMVQNTQQFYDQEQQFKIAGSLMKDGQEYMDVSPEDIAGFFDVVPVDGTLPVDRYAMANLFREMIRDMYQIPEMQQEYDLASIFEYAMQLAGAKNMDQFKVDVVDDQEMQRRAQNGESVPLSPQGGQNGQSRRTGAGADAGTGEREAARTGEPGQVPGNGSTG